MIKFHPSAQQLTDFVEGTLSPATSLMVSAHCDMCEQCQRFVEVETEKLAAQMVSHANQTAGDKVDMSLQFGDMLSQITQLPSSKQADSLTNDVFEYREVRSKTPAANPIILLPIQNSVK